MSTGTRRSWAEANRIAHDLRALFDLCYDEWIIAGSIRRKKPDVGDAEHVVRPRIGQAAVTDGLFTQIKPVNLLWKRIDELVADGTLTKHLYGGTGFRWGEKYRGAEFGGMLHEIFLCDGENRGAVTLIRTGPAEYSKRVVDAFNAIGTLRQQDGYLRYVSTGEIVPVPDEQTYFKLAGIPWVEPEDRR